MYLKNFESFGESSGLFAQRENDRRLANVKVHIGHVRFHCRFLQLSVYRK